MVVVSPAARRMGRAAGRQRYRARARPRRRDDGRQRRASRGRCLQLDLCHCGTAPAARRTKIEHTHLRVGKSSAETASSFAQIGVAATADACRRSARSFNALTASPDVRFETRSRPRVSSTSGNSRDMAGVQSLTSRRDAASCASWHPVCQCDGREVRWVSREPGLALTLGRAGSSVRVAQDGCRDTYDKETCAGRRMPGGGCQETDARRRMPGDGCQEADGGALVFAAYL
jgi:hypothetical protein